MDETRMGAEGAERPVPNMTKAADCSAAFVASAG
jgi:hypothetical protein